MKSIADQPLHFKVENFGHRGVGFRSSVGLPTGERIFLKISETEEGALRYEISFPKDSTEISSGSEISEAFSAALNYLDKKFLVNKKTIAMLDKDPLNLFGLDDPEVVQIAERLESEAALQSLADTPSLPEWEDYLRGPTKITGNFLEAKWVVEYFAETPLPFGWYSRKGIGNLIYFTGPGKTDQSWLHPYYPRFKKLYDSVRSGSVSVPKQLKIRISRLLSLRKAEEPVVSPEMIEAASKILDAGLTERSVRLLKFHMKLFANELRDTGDISEESVANFLDNSRSLTGDAEKNSACFSGFLNGTVSCVECGEVAIVFCGNCSDFFCFHCDERMHARGRRRSHELVRLEICSRCQKRPGRVVRKADRFCHDCFVHHVLKELEPEERIKNPELIDYAGQLKNLEISVRLKTLRPEREWHSFHDGEGKVFYYNFKTRERMRREPI